MIFLSHSVRIFHICTTTHNTHNTIMHIYVHLFLTNFNIPSRFTSYNNLEILIFTTRNCLVVSVIKIYPHVSGGGAGQAKGGVKSKECGGPGGKYAIEKLISARWHREDLSRPWKLRLTTLHATRSPETILFNRIFTGYSQYFLLIFYYKIKPVSRTRYVFNFELYLTVNLSIKSYNFIYK